MDFPIGTLNRHQKKSIKDETHKRDNNGHPIAHVASTSDQKKDVQLNRAQLNESNDFSENLMIFFTGNIPSKYIWIIHNSESNHMSPDLSLFNSFTITNNRLPVQSASGSPHNVSHIGTVKINHKITLTNVLHIPSFKYNLLSVHHLTKNNHCAVIFFPTFCLLQDLTSKKMIGAGEERNDICYFKTENPIALNATNESDHTLWHQRLGHPSFSCLPTFISAKNKSDFPCDACLKAKHHRLLFARNDNKSNIHFNRIYCDIWGAYHIKSSCGVRYFLTIVDEYSRNTWVYLLQKKSDALSKINLFIQMVKTQFNVSIKIFRSDNAQDFLFGSMQKIFEQNGILHELTCVGTPQQNVVAERKHQYILNIARSLRFHAHLPIKSWGECILTAVFLLNRTPTKNLGMILPYEKTFSNPT